MKPQRRFPSADRPVASALSSEVMLEGMVVEFDERVGLSPVSIRPRRPQQREQPREEHRADRPRA